MWSHENSRASRGCGQLFRLASALAIVCSSACQLDGGGGEPDASPLTGRDPAAYDTVLAETHGGQTSEYVEVEYRGTRRLAAVVGESLLIEGDIEVGPRDVQQAGQQKGISIRGTDWWGNLYAWPGGTVPYRFGSFDEMGRTRAQYVTAIRTAMDEIEEAVDGITFTEVSKRYRGDYILIEQDEGVDASDFGEGKCHSRVGRVGGKQKLHVSPWCVFFRDGSRRFSMHHELIHALGMHHAHTRRDRGSFISIDWPSLDGCPSTATSVSDCNRRVRTNYQLGKASTTRHLGDYDYDSVMHYGSRTFTALQNHPTTGAPWRPCPAANDTSGECFGQRTHLSPADVANLRTLYPVARAGSLIFNTGIQRLCTLEGHEQDVNVEWTGSLTYSNADNLSSARAIDPDGTFDASELVHGDYGLTCRAYNPFWAADYDYPASTKTNESIDLGKREQRSAFGQLRVLEIGLVPALF